MIVSASEMQQIEEAAFVRGIKADDLMDEAGKGIAEAIRQFFPQAGLLVLCLGKGNNAGDALVTARHLQKVGWDIAVRRAYPEEDFKPLPQCHWQQLKQGSAVGIKELKSLHELNHHRGVIVMLDGLVGIGVKGELRTELAEVVKEMNKLRQARHAVSVSLDIPSGLREDGTPAKNCVVADTTMTIAHCKRCLLVDHAVNHVGRLVLVPLADLGSYDETAADEEDSQVLQAINLLPHLHKRQFDFHKGMAGRVGIIAGEVGTIGAAVMCASSALHAGAGLITLYATENSYPLLAQTCPPEVMVKPVKDFREVIEASHDALAIGPGLGTRHQSEVLDILRQSKCPMVLDADGLNMLANHGVGLLKEVHAPLLLTPHPGEMKRLVTGKPEWQTLPRAELARMFTNEFESCTLLLKGARTVIAEKGQPLAFNVTGHPGMASGGMGDVLTGIAAALIGQGISTYDAARLGAWISGRAAEIACLPANGGNSQESFSATLITQNLGRAFESLRTLDY